jgi:hypothetical protein
LLNTFLFSYFIAFTDHFTAHFSVGRKGRKIALNRRVGQYKFGLFDCFPAVKMTLQAKIFWKPASPIRLRK